MDAETLSLFATLAVTVCAIMARFWPRPKDGSKWLPLYQIVNTVAQNSGHAANADDADSLKKKG